MAPRARGAKVATTRCLQCARELGYKWERTLRRIYKHDGIEAARKAAKEGGVEMPDGLIVEASETMAANADFAQLDALRAADETDAAAVARGVARAGKSALERTMEASHMGDSMRTARFAQAAQRLWQTHETLTGGMRPLPPKIRVVFQLVKSV